MASVGISHLVKCPFDHQHHWGVRGRASDGHRGYRGQWVVYDYGGFWLKLVAPGIPVAGPDESIRRAQRGELLVSDLCVINTVARVGGMNFERVS